MYNYSGNVGLEHSEGNITIKRSTKCEKPNPLYSDVSLMAHSISIGHGVEIDITIQQMIKMIFTLKQYIGIILIMTLDFIKMFLTVSSSLLIQHVWII